MKIAIIGTGPTAWSAYLGVKAKMPNSEVTFFDGGNRFTSDEGRTFVSGQKRKFGSAHMYSLLPNATPSDKTLNFSLANGGLSTTWGAGLRVWPKESLEKLGLVPTDIYESAVALIKHLPVTGTHADLGIPKSFFPKVTNYPKGSDQILSDLPPRFDDGIEIQRPALAIQTTGLDGCVGCGQCLSGCPYGSIFDAGDFIDRIIASKKASRVKGIVKKIQQIEEQVFVSVSKDAFTMTYIFEEVIVCAGAIGTPALLIQSEIIQTAKIKDSQVFYFIGFSLRKLRSQNDFALSRNSMYRYGLNKDSFYASLYTCNSEIRERISKYLAKYLLGMKISIPKIFDSYLISGIGFLHSDVSGFIELKSHLTGEIQVSVNENKLTKKFIANALKSISGQLIRHKILVPTKFFVRPKTSEGFHCGSATPIDGDSLNQLGQVRHSPRIRIGDSSTLNFIEPGPHTFMAMCLVYSKIMKG
jgi:ferredoxin